MNNYISSIENKYKQAIERFDEIALINQAKVLDAFKNARVESRHFHPSTGYGYGDIARDNLEGLFSLAFGSEASMVRPQFGSAPMPS